MMQVEMKHLKLFMNNQGFTLIELIFSLFICSLSITLISSALTLIPHLIKENESLQDEIGLSQLRHIGLLGKDLFINMDGLEMNYLGDNITIHQIGKRIVKEPGFHIILQDISSSIFTEKDTCIYLTYEKVDHNNEQKRFITCH